MVLLHRFRLDAKNIGEHTRHGICTLKRALQALLEYVGSNSGVFEEDWVPKERKKMVKLIGQI